ncbi:MAG: diaminopimelate decarboxylase [Cardiobacteriaceae bacterium]|nr:diaminopimelate decarboxylase [Cardiobacteriaceae bacterium]
MQADYWSILSQNSIDGVRLDNLAEEYSTPLYVYSENKIAENIDFYKNYPSHPTVNYAVKANGNLSLLAMMAERNLGFDIVSEGELRRVLQAAGSDYAKKCVFSGVGKTNQEIRFALENDIGCFNVESRGELQRISQIAAQLNVAAPIALRVNPDIDAKTHPYISTGMRDNKFGVAITDAMEIYRQAARDKNLQIIGVACHIGSQITELAPFVAALRSVKILADELNRNGIVVKHLDIGGGLGVENPDEREVPTIRQYLDALYAELSGSDYQLALEPGRSLVANSALLLTRVVGIKRQSGKTFLVVDAAMNDFVRVAMYQAKVDIRNLSRADYGICDEEVDVVGPVCESGDTFIKAMKLQAKVGDLLAISGAGAYGISMSSQYNARRRAAEVLLADGATRLIRKRDEYAQLWENEINL